MRKQDAWWDEDESDTEDAGGEAGRHYDGRVVNSSSVPAPSAAPAQAARAARAAPAASASAPPPSSSGDYQNSLWSSDNKSGSMAAFGWSTKGSSDDVNWRQAMVGPPPNRGAASGLRSEASQRREHQGGAERPGKGHKEPDNGQLQRDVKKFDWGLNEPLERSQRGSSKVSSAAPAPIAGPQLRRVIPAKRHDWNVTTAPNNATVQDQPKSREAFVNDFPALGQDPPPPPPTALVAPQQPTSQKSAKTQGKGEAQSHQTSPPAAWKASPRKSGSAASGADIKKDLGKKSQPRGILTKRQPEEKRCAAPASDPEWPDLPIAVEGGMNAPSPAATRGVAAKKQPPSKVQSRAGKDNPSEKLPAQAKPSKPSKPSKALTVSDVLFSKAGIKGLQKRGAKSGKGSSMVAATKRVNKSRNTINASQSNSFQARSGRHVKLEQHIDSVRGNNLSSSDDAKASDGNDTTFDRKPKKKKLSSLKKRILLERVSRYDAINHTQSSSSPAPLNAAPPSTVAAPADGAEPTTETDAADAADAAVSLLLPGHQAVVYLHGVVSLEDVEDDDEYEELLDNFSELFVPAPLRKYLSGVDLPRHTESQLTSREAEGGMVTVTLRFGGGDTAHEATAEAVAAAKECARVLHGVVIGGKPASTKFKLLEGGAAKKIEAFVMIRKFTDMESLDDDDEFEELLDNLSELGRRVPGFTGNVKLPRNEEQAKEQCSSDNGFAVMSAGDTCLTFADLAAALAAADVFRGMMLGGQELGAFASVYAYEDAANAETCVWLFDMVGAWDEVEDDDEFEEVLENVRSLLLGACKNALENQPEYDEDGSGDNGSLDHVRRMRSIFDEFLRDEEDSVDVSMPARSLYLEKQQDQEEEGEKEGDKEQGRADDSVHPIPAIRINFRSSSAAEAAQAVLNGVVVGGQQVSAVRSLGSVPSPPERLPASSASASSSSSTATSGGGVDHKENDDAPAPEPEISLTRNGKKIPVKYAGAKKVPKIGNKSSVREYVTQQRLDGELDQLCFDLIAQLFEYQERLRLRDPTKAKLRRRLVFGLREVKRGIKIGKIKCVIVAPNIDEGNFEGGLDDTVNEIISLGRSEESCENVIFALSKRRLGKALGKQIKVSAVGVYSMDGAHDTYKKVKKRLAALE